ncbi:hypothetical protein DLAC_00791 [Tieghemostelium lacteum]|uniref:AB hydrolase-1 domain-containing protein n=1 Tax=Tieghemostelium lacteum TaxID=361077 RepID=A0A152A6Y7_TIELA|nr:hypothetical protein DLAC_00791 [Tieghemostelium lacteum]|eukprot:KYR01998.1 hypothetical protein DLAC_00791 [Tieghemostelium lacteum]
MDKKNDVKERKVKKDDDKVVNQNSSEKNNNNNSKKDRVVNRSNVEVKDAGCIRVFGIIVIALLTFVLWSGFNQIDPNSVDPSLYIKEMPKDLLDYYQSGTYIPVYHHGKRMQVFMTSKFDSTTTSLQHSEVVLFIHGQMTTGFVFRKSIEGLVKEHVHPVVIDLPCFGFSDSLQNCTYDAIADSLPDILDALQLKSVHIVTYDTGAVIASLFYDRNPHRVKSISFGDPVLDISRLPSYYNIFTTPILNRFALQLATSPYLSWIRYQYFTSFFGSTVPQDIIDSYSYAIRYKNNINRFLSTIENSDFSFTTTHSILHSKLITTNYMKQILTSKEYTETYQSKFIINHLKFERMDFNNAEFLSPEEEPYVFEINIVLLIDFTGKDLRQPIVKSTPPPPTPPQPSTNTHAEHDHDHQHDHGHSHGGGHGHSHGGGHGHGHSHGGGNGHGHGSMGEFGLGHNYGL